MSPAMLAQNCKYCGRALEVRVVEPTGRYDTIIKKVGVVKVCRYCDRGEK